MDQRQSLAKLLRRLAEIIERGSDEDFEAILSGQAKLVAPNGSVRVRGKRGADSVHLGLSREKELAGLGEHLRSLESRDEGIALLRGADLQKRDLERLARLMNLPVLREDDAEKLRQKIVEHGIGSRLNSRAIRGA
jgi:hypothetical protein